MSFQCEIGKNRFPFSVVWGSLPCLTWLCPFIGHLGITDSKGQVHDFAGPYTICIDDFMTGPVYKYWQIDPRTIDFPSLKNGEARNHAEAWDLALKRGDDQYRKMMVCRIQILALLHSFTQICVNSIHYVGIIAIAMSAVYSIIWE